MKKRIPGLVSIVTPVYQAEKFLPATLAAVRAQTYTDWEWLLVDDASPDQSKALLNKAAAADERLKVLTHEKNQGAAVARNTGLAAARGQYVAFVDSDDLWEPEKLARQVAFMQERELAFTYTNFSLISEAGETLKERVSLPKQLTYSGLLKNTAIACSTVVIDVSQLGDFQMPLVRKGQDTATWLMLMRERGVTAYLLDEVLNHYRQVQGSVSSNKFKALKRTWHTYRQLEGLSWPVAAYNFLCYAFNALKRRL